MPGSIHFYIGPMGCGKTKEIIDEVEQDPHIELKDKKRSHLLIAKPHTPFITKQIKTRKEEYNTLEADVLFSNKNELEDAIRQAGPAESTKVILDEFQFFQEDGIAKLIDGLANEGYEFHIAALPTSFKGHTFEGQIENVLPYADKITVMKSACSVCKRKNGIKTTRIEDGVAASYSSDTVKLKEDDTTKEKEVHEKEIEYYARCRKHHEVLNKKSEYTDRLQNFENDDGELIIISGGPNSGKAKSLESRAEQYSELAEVFSKPPKIEEILESKKQVIMIRDYQELTDNTEEYAKLFDEMANRGYTIILEGDALDQNNVPYESIKKVLPLADEIKMIFAKRRENGNGIVKAPKWSNTLNESVSRNEYRASNLNSE